ncbi:hypothetical protein [Selenomonas bovis]|uniref:hypothetical protein n=1 Tax=Selenomonas bovis TaxID=416586 RepID=UPI0003A94C84|nr:hypothetical protein [Selenomonas bovis]
MLGLTLSFMVLLLFYFAIRVNRMEIRLNLIEKAVNDAIREGKLDTEFLGKPFGGDSLGVVDFFYALKDAWNGSGKANKAK